LLSSSQYVFKIKLCKILLVVAEDSWLVFFENIGCWSLQFACAVCANTQNEVAIRATIINIVLNCNGIYIGQYCLFWRKSRFSKLTVCANRQLKPKLPNIDVTLYICVVLCCVVLCCVVLCCVVLCCVVLCCVVFWNHLPFSYLICGGIIQ
jgi:hypothetical protein